MVHCLLHNPYCIMKYITLTFLLLLIFSLVSCGGDKTKNTATAIELKDEVDAVELLEDEDFDDIDESIDETDHLESAMTSLENGDTQSAAESIMNAVESMKEYMGEVDDTTMVTNAIDSLTKVATELKSGKIISSEDLQKVILSLALFSEDELEEDFDDM